MKNKILIYTDNHFCQYSSIVRGRGKVYSTRLENQIKTMSWLNTLAQEHDCCSLYCCGDFFDRADLNAEELTALSEIDFHTLPHNFIVGNHEIARSDCEFSTTQTFLQNNQCDVYSRPSVLGLGNTLIYILPYITDIDKKSVLEYFNSINIPDTYKYRILLMHNDIKGMYLGKFITETGFEITDLSQNFNLVINGHLHNQCWVAKNVLNLGNITGQNFSEDGFKYKHQAILVDLDTLECSLYTNPYALNFYKIDWSAGASIDEINRISGKMCNYVATIKTDNELFEYVKQRFDPTIPDNNVIPKNCNGVAARVTKATTMNITTQHEVSELHVDHLKAFEKFIMQSVGDNDVVKQELQEVLK